jgi:hypothetical protein
MVNANAKFVLNICFDPIDVEHESSTDGKAAVTELQARHRNVAGGAGSSSAAAKWSSPGGSEHLETLSASALTLTDRRCGGEHHRFNGTISQGRARFSCPEFGAQTIRRIKPSWLRTRRNRVDQPLEPDRLVSERPVLLLA